MNCPEKALTSSFSRFPQPGKAGNKGFLGGRDFGSGSEYLNVIVNVNVTGNDPADRSGIRLPAASCAIGSTRGGRVKSMSARKVTIRDIAQRAGVSANTVSRALAERGEIRPETREKILAIARELHYVPNSLARGLVSRRSDTFGVIVPDSHNPFHAAVISEIQERLRAKGIGVLVVNSHRTPGADASAAQLLIKNQVDGVLIFPRETSDSYLAILSEHHIPFVLVGTEVSDPTVPSIMCQDDLGGYLATRHLLEQGCRHVVMLAPAVYSLPARLRARGYERALQEFGRGRPRIIRQRATAGDLELGYTLARSLPFEEEGIDGIFAFNDLMAIGALRALAERRISVPGDVAVVGYDNVEMGSYVTPSLTSVDLPAVELGKEACDLLLRMLAEEDSPGEKPVAHLKLKPELVVRESSLRGVASQGARQFRPAGGEADEEGER